MKASFRMIALCAAAMLTGIAGDTGGVARETWIRLGDGSLQIKIPGAWRVDKYKPFESEFYKVFRGKTKLFFIYLGNNPDLHDINYSKFKRPLLLGGIQANEYLLHGTVTDILATPHCGRYPYQYVWLGTRLTQAQGAATVVAMKSLRCAKGT